LIDPFKQLETDRKFETGRLIKSKPSSGVQCPLKEPIQIVDRKVLIAYNFLTIDSQSACRVLYKTPLALTLRTLHIQNFVMKATVIHLI